MNLNLRLILFLLVLVMAGIFSPLKANAQYYGNYAYRKKLTLNTTNYISGSSNLTNFTVLLSITDADLIRTGASSDKLKSSTANDIAFTDATVTQSSATEYSYQIESYDAATGKLNVWVKIPILKKSANNTVYFYFGSSNPPTHPSATDAWTSDYLAVYHFNESSYSTSSGDIKDGTSNSNHATLSSSSNSLVSGKIGNAYAFTGSQKISSTTSNFEATSSFTVSAWIKPTTLGLDQKIITNQGSDGKGYKMGVFTNNKVESEFNHGYATNNTRSVSGGTALVKDNWYYVQTVVGGGKMKTYVNGVQERQINEGSDAMGSILYIGVGEGGNVYYFNGVIDEVRITNTAKSTDWLKTEYNNQLYPGNPGTGTGLSGGDPFIKSYDALEVLVTPPSTPTDVNAVANSVAENATNGTTVGITASSTSANGTITYMLSDDAGGRFAINSSTGVVTVANGTLLNYEAATSHSITVLVSDGVTTSSQTFAIALTNVVEPLFAPSDVNTDPNSVAENAINGTTVGITAYTEGDASTTLTYSLTDDAGGRFTINASTGVVSVANGTLLNYEANASHTITVQVSNGSETKSTSFTITITDVVEDATGSVFRNYVYRKKLTLNTTNYISGSGNLSNFPVLLEIHDSDLIHNGTASDKVKSATGNDIAFTDATVTQSAATELSYQLESYDASTGVLKVWVRIPTLTKATNNTIYLYFGSDSPAAHPAASTTWASDYKAVFHFNESSYSTSANAILDATGTNHATLSSSSNNMSTGFINNAYSFNGTNQVMVTTNSVQSASTFTVSAWVKASVLGIDQKIFSNQDASGKGFKMGIYTNNKVESELNSDGRTFNNRDATGGTTLSSSTWYYMQTVYESDNIKTYINGQLDRSGFAVAGTVGGKLYIGAAALNESGGSRFYFNGIIDELRVSSVAKSPDWLLTEFNNQRYPSNIGTGLSGGSPFISVYGNLETVNTAPQTPTDINTSANAVAENSSNGTLVGLTVSSSDPEQTVVSYSLTDDAGGRFTINSSTGVVSVANGSLLNYEKTQSHSITVLASDGVFTSSATFTIAVTNVIEPLGAITDLNNSADAISEDARTGQNVPITAFAEHELDATVVYSLTNNAGGRFSINSATGVVSVTSASFDYETTPSHSITIQAYDGKTTITQDYTITVTDFYEGFSSGYAFRKSLTLNNTTLGLSTDLSNYPALLKIQDDNLIQASNCAGAITSSSNPDIAFIDANNVGSELNYEIQSYEPTTGTIYVWVKLLTLTASANSSLYVYFGTDAADVKHTEAFKTATWTGVPQSPGADWTKANTLIQAAPQSYTSNGTLEVFFEKARTLPGALVYTWTGATSTDPADASNWTCTTSGTNNLLPSNTGTATIVIPWGLSRYPSLSSSFSAYGLAIASGASLSLNGNILNVKCNFYNNGSLLYNDNNNSTLAFTGSLTNQTYQGNTTNGQVGKLEINNLAGNVTLSGGMLDVYHLLTVNANTLIANGYLTLKAAATSSAMVAAMPSGASIQGDVNVEVFFTGGNTNLRGTRSFSSPINENLSQQNTYQQLKNYMILTGPGGVLNGFDSGGAINPNGASLTRYYEPATASQSQFTSVSRISEPLPPGFGVFIFYRGSRDGYSSETALTSNKLNAPYGIPENTIVKFKGPINQGDVEVNLSFTDNPREENRNGFNLIGNPYPAIIDWDEVDKTDLDSLLIIAKPTGGFGTYKNNITVNATGMNLRYIQPGLAFYVKAAKAGAKVTFTERSKVIPVATPSRLLNTNRTDAISFNGQVISSVKSAAAPKTLRIILEDKSNTEETVVIFGDKYKPAVSSEDAPFFGGSTVTLSTIASDNAKLTINGLPQPTSTTIIPLSVNASATGDVKLSFTDLSALSNTQLSLADNYLNKTIEINTVNDNYSFNINKSVSGTYGDNRFRLIISPPTVLPVNLADFKAQRQADGIQLTWSASVEKDSREFVLERSANGNDFIEVSRIKVTSVGKYSFRDLDAREGNNYYRLSLVDVNNNVVVSSLAFADFRLNNSVIATVFPNPAAEFLNIQILKNFNNITAEILTIDAKVIKRLSFPYQSQLKLPIADLSSGSYILQLKDEHGTVFTRLKFIKD